MSKTREQIIREYAEKAFIPNDDARGFTNLLNAIAKYRTGGDYPGSSVADIMTESAFQEENLRPVINELNTDLKANGYDPLLPNEENYFKNELVPEQLQPSDSPFQDYVIGPAVDNILDAVVTPEERYNINDLNDPSKNVPSPGDDTTNISPEMYVKVGGQWYQSRSVGDPNAPGGISVVPVAPVSEGVAKELDRIKMERESQAAAPSTDNDATSAPPLPGAEEVQQADNPEDVGEESMNPWGATDNDAEHTSPLPTAEEVQQADNPDDVGEESMNPWGATDNDAENAGDPANVTPESDADLEQRYLEQQLNAGTRAIREGKALVDAIEEGDDLSIIENALDLTGSLNTLSSNLTGDGRALLSGNVTAGMNALAAGAGLLGAIEGGDDWAITSSSVNLLKGVDDFLENMGHDLIADKIDIGLDGKGMDLFGGAAMTGAALAYDMAMETYCVEIEI